MRPVSVLSPGRTRRRTPRYLPMAAIACALIMVAAGIEIARWMRWS
jgi:hypothetical protein